MTTATRAMPDVLGIVSEQLTVMHGEALSLQVAIGAMLTGGKDSQDAIIEGLQAVDLLTQKLHGLAQYLEALSSAAPRSMTIDASKPLEAVSLASLAASLDGGAS